MRLGLTPVMARPRIIMEFKVIAEHGQQVFFQPHDQRVHPGVEDDIRAFDPHLRAVPRREVLHMHGRGNDRAGNSQTLADMPLHLGAEDHLGRQILDRTFDFEIIVGDQGCDTEFLGHGADLARHFAVIAAQAHHLEPGCPVPLIQRGQGGKVTLPRGPAALP